MAFVSQRRVDFPMVDLAKIVYYPRFWDLAHRFYEESWEFSCGMHYNTILSEHKIAFPLVHRGTSFVIRMEYCAGLQTKLRSAQIWVRSRERSPCPTGYEKDLLNYLLSDYSLGHFFVSTSLRSSFIFASHQFALRHMA